MCGITGLVDYRRDLRGEVALARAMTGTLAHRGPDGEGLFLGRHAFLGSRRLAVVDPAGGAQPMEAVHGGRSAVVVLCGEIYNHRRLRVELESYGHRFRTGSDTEVVGHAYLRWPDFAERLEGMYAIGIWDIRLQTLLLGRDPRGVKPLCWAPVPGGTVFGSEPKAVLASGLVSRKVNREGMCEILDMLGTPGITPYASIREVKPGHLLRVTAAQTNETPFYSLEAREHAEGGDLPLTVQNTRTKLKDQVTSQLAADVPRCIMLSGGLDSSAVTGAAAEALDPEPVSTFSVALRSTGQFEADAVRGTDDEPFARMAAGHAGAKHHTIVLDTAELASESVRSAVLHATDAPPAYWGDMWPSLYLLSKAIRDRGYTVALSGEFADELFGGYPWFRNPRALSAGTFPWLTAGGSRYFGGSSLLSRDLIGKLDTEGYRAARYHEAIAQAPVLPGESRDEKAMRQVRYLALRFGQLLLKRADSMSMAAGLEVRVPYTGLTDYLYNVPWWMHTFDGREKSLLRAAAAGLIPEAVAARPKKPYPATQDPAYERILRRRLADLLTDRNAPALALLDVDRARRAASRQVGQASQPYDRGSIEMALWLNQWLCEYQIDLDLP